MCRAWEEQRILDVKKGREEGIKEGIKLMKLVSDGKITIENAAKEAGMDTASFEELMKSR